MPVVRVAVRVAATEIENEALAQRTEILADEAEGRVTIRSGSQIIFSSTFDHVQRHNTKAGRVYEVAAAPIVQNIIEGNEGILVVMGTLSSGELRQKAAVKLFIAACRPCMIDKSYSRAALPNDDQFALYAVFDVHGHIVLMFWLHCT
eukprot:5111917-Pleurochrysis_carterae.AAC.4